MLDLLQIEWIKMKQSKAFWIFGLFFAIFLLSVPVASKALLDYIATVTPEGESFSSMVDFTNLPVFDFVDIWQNLTWIYKNFSILLGFLVVISVCNEYSYGTIKQNVIDGWTRLDFLHSKMSLILAFALLSGVAVFVVGCIMGALWSPVKSVDFVFLNAEFVLAYMLHLVGFLMFCLLIAVLLKRSGLALTFLLFYVYVIENIGYGLLRWELEMPELANFLPVKATGALIPFPFGKYALQETQTYVSWYGVLVVAGYIVLMYAILSWRLRKKDLV